MKRRGLVLVLAALFVLAVPTVSVAQEGMPLILSWDDLLPEGELERLEELYAEGGMSAFLHMGFYQPEQIGTFNVVEELDGRRVLLPGFVLPLDLQFGAISEFLLVPYFGACIHVPPPPPNQIVYVQAETPIEIEELWAPVWVEGVLSTKRHLNDLGDTAYSLALIAVAPYQVGH
jgi:uncharacterized protein